MEKTSSNIETTVSKPDIAVSSDIYVDPVIEKQALSKFDKFLLPQMAIMVLIAYLDRSNIGRCWTCLVKSITKTNNK